MSTRRRPSDKGAEVWSRGESHGWFPLLDWDDVYTGLWPHGKRIAMTWGEYCAMYGLNPWIDWPDGKKPEDVQ